MPKSKNSGLTTKQKRFVEEYPVDWNGTQAAKRAGYKGNAKTLSAVASENLEKPIIQAALKKSFDALSEKVGLTVDWIVERLIDNVERAMQEVPVLDREGGETGEYQYQGAVANRSLELLGKHKGMFLDRLELTGVQKFEVKLPERPESLDRPRVVQVGSRAIESANGSGDGKGSNGQGGDK